jgi:hypothetical protein
VFGNRNNCQRESHERDLSHRRGNHSVAGEGIGGGKGGTLGAGVAPACGTDEQFSDVLEESATPYVVFWQPVVVSGLV